MVKKKILLISLIFSVITNSAIGGSSKEEHYDNAVTLGECAALFTIYSQIYESTKQPAQAKDASMKSNGWRIATLGALYKAGWRNESLVITMNSIYEGTVTKWLAKIEGESKTLSDEIKENTATCIEYNEEQENYRKFYKVNGYPK